MSVCLGFETSYQEEKGKNWGETLGEGERSDKQLEVSHGICFVEGRLGESNHRYKRHSSPESRTKRKTPLLHGIK
jgi:hypothetical protein